MLRLVGFGFGGWSHLTPIRGRDLLCSTGALQVQHCRSLVVGVLTTAGWMDPFPGYRGDETMLNWQQDGFPPFLPKTPGSKFCVENCQHVFFWFKMSWIHSGLKTKNPCSSSSLYMWNQGFSCLISLATEGFGSKYIRNWKIRGMELESQLVLDGWFHGDFTHHFSMEMIWKHLTETTKKHIGCLGYPEFINAPEIQWAKFRGCSHHGMIPHGKFKDSGNPIRV